MRIAVVLIGLATITTSCQTMAQQIIASTQSQVDTDSDGLSDQLEQSLLTQFAPAFMIGKKECSNLPAEFRIATASPEAQEENGTIYGQVFPAHTSTFSRSHSGDSLLPSLEQGLWRTRSSAGC